MKKGTFLFIVAAMLAVFTACGSGGNHEESATQAEYSVTEEMQQTAQENADGGGVSAESGNPGSDAVWSAYGYEPDIIRYGEPSGTFSFRKDVERTQTGCAVYYFETSIGEQERQACITATDRMLSSIGGVLPPIEIAVFQPETMEGIFVSGNRLYTTIRFWDEIEYHTGVLLAGYGGWGNYGLAYGYANYLCKKASFNGGEAGPDYREADGFLPMSIPELYDLNLLCFDERFASLEDVEAAKNNACLFVDKYLSAHSEEELLTLLSASGTAEGVSRANEALEAFYAENGVECSLTKIRYQYGGVTVDYAAACEYASFYIEKDWQDETWKTNPMVSENFLHEDYKEVKAFFECNARQMGQYQELFGFESYNNDLTVVCSNSARTSALEDSYYSGADHTVCISSAVALMHEYIHSVMAGNCDWRTWWKWEGFAGYYDARYNAYAYDFWDYDYNNQPENERGIRIKKYIDWIDRPFNSKTDHWELKNVIVYACGYRDPNINYTTGESFVGYLVEQYGEQAVIAYVCSDKKYNAEWGKSYEELVQDWNNYIDVNYAWYNIE